MTLQVLLYLNLIQIIEHYTLFNMLLSYTCIERNRERGRERGEIFDMCVSTGIH